MRSWSSESSRGVASTHLGTRQTADRRRTRLSAVRARCGASVFSAGPRRYQREPPLFTIAIARRQPDDRAVGVEACYRDHHRSTARSGAAALRPPGIGALAAEDNASAIGTTASRANEMQIDFLFGQDHRDPGFVADRRHAANSVSTTIGAKLQRLVEQKHLARRRAPRDRQHPSLAADSRLPVVRRRSASAGTARGPVPASSRPATRRPPGFARQRREISVPAARNRARRAGGTSAGRRPADRRA